MSVEEQVLEVVEVGVCVTQKLPFQYCPEEHCGEDPVHSVPLKYCADVHAAALRHLSASGMPKSGLVESPAPGIHTFACEERTSAHAALSVSMREALASVRIHERRPELFHTCSRCPPGG